MPTTTFQINAGSKDGHAQGSFPHSTYNMHNMSDATVRALKANDITSVALLEFDASSLPDTAFIQSAVLKTYVSSAKSDNSRSVCGEYYNWNGTSSDFTNTESASAFDAVALTTIPLGAWYSFTLKDAASSISKTGATKLRIHITGAGDPSGDNWFYFHSYNNSATTAAKLEVTYVTNLDPLQGAWTGSTPSEGGVSPVTPTLQGTMPHDAAETWEYSQSVQLLAFNTATPSTIYVDNEVRDTTTAERAAGVFTWDTSTFPADTGVTIRFRHKDSQGAWSPFSADRSFTTSPGPQAPTSLVPNSKINVISGYTYAAEFNTTGSLNATAAQLRLYNSTGLTTLYDSGEVAITSTAPDGTVLITEASLTGGTPTGHPDLSWATNYQWDIRFKDSGGAWGVYSAKQTFSTNRVPNAPTNLSPSGNQVTSSRLFSASVSDPDGDAVTAEIELVNATTNVVVSGYPKAMTVATGTATFTAPEADMTLGTDYKFRVRASDGNPNSPGPYSAYSFLQYRTVPELTMLGPQSNRVNQIPQPSAEYAISVFWTETARTGTDYIDRTQVDNALEGSYVWRATTSASGDNRFRSEYIDVDSTKAFPAYVRANKISGTTAMHFTVLCYDAANTLLGTVYPGTSQTGDNPANAYNAPFLWTTIGGLVWPAGSTINTSSRFATGTTKIKYELTPSRNSAAVVDFDGFSLDEMAAPADSARWTAARDWYGYADGDTELNSPVLSYAWLGTTGDSESDVLPVLTGIPASVSFNYFHATALAKTDDRLVFERWNGTEYVAHHDTGYMGGGARTVIPMPTVDGISVVKNEGSYRVKVYAKDSAGFWGESEWLPFDVLYEIVSGLPNFQVEPDAPRAALVATWEPLGLDETFVGIEILRETVSASELRPEPVEVIDVIRDPAATSYTYHYPRSGVEYRISGRVVVTIGTEQVASRTSKKNQTVDYYPYSFLKDTEDPDSYYAAFDTTIENLAAIEEDAPMVSMLAWGQSGYSHAFSSARLRSGEVVAEFHPDALNVDSSEVRYERVRDVVYRRRAICLLSQLPDAEKAFIAVSGPVQRGMLNVVAKFIRFPYQETLYSEDFYERNGSL